MVAFPLIRDSDVVSVSLIIIFLLLNYRIWAIALNKKFRVLNCFLFLFASISIFSINSAQGEIGEYLDYGSRTTTLARGLYWNMTLLSSILFVEYCVNKKLGIKFVEIFFQYLLVYVFIINIDALLFASRASIVKDLENNLYLAGNKFDLTYTNLYLVIIYGKYSLIKGVHDQRIYLFFLAVAFFMAFWSKCSTSIIGFTFFSFFVFTKLHLKKIAYNPYVYITFSFICTFLLFLFSAIILSHPSVRSLLFALGESEDLTSRLYIWERSLEIIDVRPLLGFGQGNVGMIIRRMTNCADAQNGVLDLYLQNGILGVIAYFSMLIYFLKKAHLHTSSRNITAFLYTIMVISMVEIPLSAVTLFLLSFSLVNPQNSSQNKSIIEIFFLYRLVKFCKLKYPLNDFKIVSK